MGEHKKEKAVHTIDKEVFDQFKKMAKDKAINRSALLEQLIQKWMNENQ